MGKGLLTIDNILILGIAGGAGAYFMDIGGFKGTVDQAISDFMNMLKLGNGNGNVDCTTHPEDPSCTSTGTGCDDPACVSECCKCKCSNRTECPEGVCCQRCRTQCPAQCASSAYARSNLVRIPDNLDGRRRW